jgi:hypothetical protein
MIVLAIVIALQAASSERPVRVPMTLSVCDVLADDPTKLNGKVTKVKGLLGGTDEGTWLTAECTTHLVTKGLAWGNDLSVYIDGSDQKTLRSWEKVGQKLKQLRANLGQDRIWVTIVGRLETRASMDDEVVQMPYGMARAGFGHMGGTPAEINVISVEDVRVERKSRQ